MQYHWLNRANNKRLIIFFAGWSFDQNPFQFLKPNDYDILILFDYNNLNIPETPEYEDYYLITWSMGVFTAYLLKDELPKFSKKIAINGTPYPVDNFNGIPIKPFLLTLKHAQQGLQGKFYQNIFNSPEEFEIYLKNPVKRSIENRVNELKNLYSIIQNTELKYDKYYNQALISQDDKIIPVKNQINFWTNNIDNYKMLESGHFPFYNFSCWDDILKCT